MSKPTKVIRVFVKSNPTVQEYGRCNNVGQTLRTWKGNILAIKGKADGKKHERFVKFKDYTIKDIAFQVYEIRDTLGWSDIK